MFKQIPDKQDQIFVKSVNWHLWPWCNYSCRFCFSNFHDIKKGKKKYLELEEGKKLIKILYENGLEKLTFVGGEPLLCPFLPKYLKFSKELGIINMIVSNGSLLTESFLDKYGALIDWIGLSIDSVDDNIEKKLGRGNGSHIKNIRNIVPKIKERGIKLKINITVTKLSLNEDFHPLIKELQPDRIKIFQVLEIEGENKGNINDLLITEEEFKQFYEKHKDLDITPETNEMMTSSYVMIDPLGRFFHNTSGKIEYSHPILEVGIKKAWQEITFNKDKFLRRDGLYYRRIPK